MVNQYLVNKTMELSTSDLKHLCKYFGIDTKNTHKKRLILQLFGGGLIDPLNINGRLDKISRAGLTTVEHINMLKEKRLKRNIRLKYLRKKRKKKLERYVNGVNGPYEKICDVIGCNKFATTYANVNRKSYTIVMGDKNKVTDPLSESNCSLCELHENDFLHSQ